jgi:DNA topoisomerase-1
MRTDSVNVSKEAQVEARTHVMHHFGDEFVPEKMPTFQTKAKLAQEAHEAVRPTSVERTPKRLKKALKRDQFRLYRLIWERFVASQMAAAIYDTVSADVWAGDPGSPVEGRQYQFRAAGSSLRFAGFLALYEETRPTDRPENGENPILASLQAGELLDLLTLLPEQHFTQPPPRYSEATLVKELEENGIGRPSTYASIISTISSRGYVEYEERRLAPTPIGELVNDLLVEYFPDVMSVDFTARMEGELDEVANGRAWVPVIDEFYRQFAQRLDVADKAIEKVDVRSEPEPVGRDCPRCGNPLVYREGRYGRFIGCSDFPSCRHTEQIVKKLGIACPNDGGEIIERKTRKGRIFYGCANYPECDWTNWKRPIATPCEVCGGLMVAVKKGLAECTVCGERQEVDTSEQKVEYTTI